MISVVGTWELGWNTPILEHDLWVYPLRDFGVDKHTMVPVSGIKTEYVLERDEMSAVLEEERSNGQTIVFVDERGDVELDAFVHPTNATYVLGKASFSPFAAHFVNGDLSVRIKTPNQLATLWPHQAITLVLNDRFKKEQ